MPTEVFVPTQTRSSMSIPKEPVSLMTLADGRQVIPKVPWKSRCKTIEPAAIHGWILLHKEYFPRHFTTAALSNFVQPKSRIWSAAFRNVLYKYFNENIDFREIRRTKLNSMWRELTSSKEGKEMFSMFDCFEQQWILWDYAANIWQKKKYNERRSRKTFNRRVNATNLQSSQGSSQGSEPTQTVTTGRCDRIET